MRRRTSATIARRWTVLAALAALTLVAGACGSDDGGDAFETSDAAAVGADGSDGTGDGASADDGVNSSDDGDAGAGDGSSTDGDTSTDGDSSTGGDTTAEGDDAASDDGDSGHGGDGPSPGDDGGDNDSGDIVIPQGHEGFCGDFYDFLQATVDLLNVYFDGDPASVEAAAGPVRESMAALHDSAPEELLADLELANGYFETMLDILEAHGYDVAAANADPAMAVETTDEAAQAEETLNQYVIDECDYDPEAIGLSPPS